MASSSHPKHAALDRLLDEAVEAEIDLEHEPSVDAAERGLIRRAVRIVAGTLLVIAGILLLVLPGPGLIVIAAGLGLLSRDVPFARRWLAIVRSRIPERPDGAVAGWVVVGSAGLALLSVAVSIGWLVLH